MHSCLFVKLERNADGVSMQKAGDILAWQAGLLRV